jgi:hypothetical protein
MMGRMMARAVRRLLVVGVVEVLGIAAIAPVSSGTAAHSFASKTHVAAVSARSAQAARATHPAQGVRGQVLGALPELLSPRDLAPAGFIAIDVASSTNGADHDATRSRSPPLFLA